MSAASYAPLLRRLSALAILYILELVAISIWLDNSALAGGKGLVAFSHDWGAWILRSVVGFAGLFVTCAFLKHRPLLEQISSGLAAVPVRRDLLTLHFAGLALFGWLSHLLYTQGTSLLAAVWLLAGMTAIALGGAAFVPIASWMRLARGTGNLWFYVLIAVVGACAGGSAIRFLWAPAARFTLTLVDLMLRPFLAGVVADPATMSIGTPGFSVEIAKECSGLEGIGLILAFTTLWLVLFRKEYRFPNALVLLPAGVAITFLLNAVRIAALVAIGNAGAERIALGGFHSQAGWIAFNLVALGTVVGARSVPWLTTSRGLAPSTENPTAAYLLPFIAILAAGMVSTAASAGFEWFYPLRFFAAAGVLLYFRRYYSKLGWRCTWFGPAVGLVVFVIWIALDRAVNPMPAALLGVPAGLRVLWITIRALAAAVTVPLAEELAFRGFLLRRLMAADFESVPAERFTWPALIVSSFLFGLLHGDRWFAGTLAGLVYAAALLRRGKIADAVAAHATTNAMLAGYVLLFDKWQYW